MSSTSRLWHVGAGLSLLLACGDTPQKRSTSVGESPHEAAAQAEAMYPTISALQKQLASQEPMPITAPSDAQRKLASMVDNYFQAAGTARHYLHLDKPLYQPGETIWFRIWELSSSTLTSRESQQGNLVQLISPKGATVLEKRVQMGPGMSANDFELPTTVQGGEYTLRVSSDLGGTTERKLIVSQYQAPRIKKKAEFTRKAYGPGDKVAAAVSIQRATGENLANKKLTALVQVDSTEIARFEVETNAQGNAIVKFDLPSSIAQGDGLLTLLVEDGGVTESLQKRIPIVLKNVSFDMFAEGGDLITGLPGRVYFSAKNSLGKAADVSGHVEDKQGKRIAEFRSFHNGLGRYEINPQADTEYFAVIDKPLGIKARFALPAAKNSGCALQSVDDYTGQNADLRVAVWCSEDRSIVTSAILREKRLGDYSFDIKAGKASVLRYPIALGSQGAVRVTVFDDALAPLAERLVYRGQGQDLKLSVTSDQDSYAPRDQVELTVRAQDLAGKPVEADLSLAVVDDTVLSFADDKTANMLSRLYLESEMPGQRIEEPNFYFSDDPKAAAGLDMVLGTQGWRRFAWQNILTPAPTGSETRKPSELAAAMADDAKFKDNKKREAPPPPPAMALRQPAKPGPQKAPEAKPVQVAAMGKIQAAQGRAEAPAREMAEERAFGERLRRADENDFADDEDWGGEDFDRRAAWDFAPYREFPAPNYAEAYDGPRFDFRETIHWQPSLKTNAKGEAKMRFYLSDAVTSFRVQAEGVSAGGLPGRVEQTIQSKLPVSLVVKMPLEVSRGDEIALPVTLANETKRSYTVQIDSEFGPAFKVKGGVPDNVTLKAGESKSFFAELEVIGDGDRLEDGLMRVAINAANLRDQVEQEVRVVALGFPQTVSLAGTVETTIKHDFQLSGVLPGSIDATLTMYPSPLATMITGTEAIIREPYGCFEQASSANYPNIMVLDYLEENDAADPALIETTMAHLDKGYKMLTGYESPQKGFEWFGGDPGHEALTAYGLMEFVDMKKVFGDVDQGMINRTSAWLKSRRDGKGGFKRNSRALDSFGSASEEVTNSYISYALSQSGDKDLAAELGLQKKTALASKDAYVMALAVNTLLNLEADAPTTLAALKKLIAMQDEQGSFPGADHSITRSGGQALLLETTSLAILAMIKAGPNYIEHVREAVEWINKSRSGGGGFASTQSTVLSLAALSAYADASRVTQSGGSATVYVNGKASGTLRFEKGDKGALVFDDIAASLRPGKNSIELRLDSDSPLPYSIAIDYRSKMPASSPETTVSAFTSLAKNKVPLGEGVRMKVTVKNLTDEGQPMTLARVGLPGGLSFQTWQLKELMDKKVIDFYETREREVVLYFRSLPPKAEIQVPLELIARVPGDYISPATQTYLYYTDEFRHWSEPLKVSITR